MQENDVNQQVLVILLRRIIELLDSKPEPSSLGVNNLDEIRAHLRNELLPLIKVVKEASDRSDVTKELKALKEAIKAIEVNPSINVAAAQVNIPEIKIPDIRVPDIAAPNVTVTIPDVIVPDIHIPQPIVNVEAPVVNVPDVDLSEVIQELHIGLEKLRTNNKSRPLAVRLTDGGEWIKELQVLNRHAAQTTQFMSDVSYIKDASGLRINPATEDSLQLLIYGPGDTRFDPSDAKPDYIGEHRTQGASTSNPNWKIYKFTYSGSNATRIQLKTGAWDSRATLFS